MDTDVALNIYQRIKAHQLGIGLTIMIIGEMAVLSAISTGSHIVGIIGMMMFLFGTVIAVGD